MTSRLGIHKVVFMIDFIVLKALKYRHLILIHFILDLYNQLTPASLSSHVLYARQQSEYMVVPGKMFARTAANRVFADLSGTYYHKFMSFG